MALKSLTGFDANNQRVVSVAAATQATDAVNLAQLQALVNARSPKDDVVARVTSNVTIASPGATLDGITASAGMRFLLDGQTTGSEKGIYDWNGAAVPMTRSADADSITELSAALVAVQRGSSADKLYLCTNDDTDTLGTTPITFIQTGTGTTYTAGSNGGLQLAGSAFSILLDANPGLVLGAGGLKIDTSVVARKFAANCVATTNPQTFTHNLASADVDVTIKEVSTNAIVNADVTVTDANNISVNFGGAPTAAQYRVVVMG